MRQSICIVNLLKIFTACFVMKLSEAAFNAKIIHGFELLVYTTILYYCLPSLKSG